jgi:hypothetical protein
MMKKRWKNPAEIRVGVIGYGGAFNMGKAHLQDMRAAGMTPAAVVEIDPVRLAAAAADFPGIATYASVAQMLKASGVDLVTIITPHNTHAKIGLQCLRALSQLGAELGQYLRDRQPGHLHRQGIGLEIPADLVIHRSGIHRGNHRGNLLLHEKRAAIRGAGGMTDKPKQCDQNSQNAEHPQNLGHHLRAAIMPTRIGYLLEVVRHVASTFCNKW